VEAWVGPAIVAAFISGLVSLIVVQLNFRAERRSDRLRRDEKVRDFQIALRAEIASDLLNMKVLDRAQMLQDVAETMVSDPAYVPLIPRLASNLIFDAVLKEIYILPDGVISSVVHYERLRQSLGEFIDDMRSSAHYELSVERRMLIYSDYVSTFDRLQVLAERAIAELEASLGLNKTAADPSNRASAEAAASKQFPAS
jgi:hypothetical protein